jgi:predicted 3-demethylubiquinone-9 3-methyltransferase (glyoxalase superfamily)
MQRITPCLWFDTEGEEAAKHYTSIFPNSKIVNVAHYTDAGPGEPGRVMIVEFELDGVRFTALNGGPNFKFNEAVSLQIACETQEDVDYYWDRLTADGGEEGPCGWLKDRYGVSWQVVPTAVPRLLGSDDPERAKRVTAAIMGMKKIDISELERAAAEPVGV